MDRSLKKIDIPLFWHLTPGYLVYTALRHLTCYISPAPAIEIVVINPRKVGRLARPQSTVSQSYF